MLAMAAMLSMQAQTITGNWITHVIDEESEETVTYILVFGGNRMKQAMVAETPLEGVGNVSLYFTVPAQEYTLRIEFPQLPLRPLSDRNAFI